MLTSIIGSFATVLGALVLGVPFGVLTAVIISRYTRGTVKTVFNQLIALFAGIPSVVWGFFGIIVLIPLFKNNLEGTGQGEGLLVSVIILALMIIPTIVNISVNSLDSVNDDFVQASRAMGSTENQTVYRIVLPSAKRGIVVACILGIGRALGEGIALSMVSGNANIMPEGLFSSFNTMTTLIFSSFGGSDLAARQALFCVGVTLFLFTIIINLIVNIAGKEKSAKKNGKIINFIRAKIFKRPIVLGYRTMDLSVKSNKAADFSGKMNSCLLTNIWYILSIIFFLLTFVVFTAVIGYMLINGLPLLFTNFGTVFRSYNPLEGGISLLSQIEVTLVMIVLTLIVCVPLGILAAIYLCEYANVDSWIIKAVKFAIQVLSGAPGIIIGLLGYTLFVQTSAFGRGYTLLAGVLTMSIMCLPTVINTVENAFKSVPQEYKDASTAMGVGKVRTIFNILLPQSRSGIFSAIILCVGKVVAESAALIFTSGTMKTSPSLYGSGATLAVSMYMFARDGRYQDNAYVAGVIIVIIIIVINLIMYFLQKGSKGRSKIV